MLAWILKKVGGKALGAVFSPFKMYAIAIALAAVVGTVGYYIYTAEKAKGQVAVLEVRNSTLRIAVRKAEATVKHLDGRMAAHNAQKLADMAIANEQIKAAEQAVEAIQAEHAKITEQFEVSRFNLVEVIRDDEEFADIADISIPGSVWDRVYDSANYTGSD